MLHRSDAGRIDRPHDRHAVAQDQSDVLVRQLPGQERCVLGNQPLLRGCRQFAEQRVSGTLNQIEMTGTAVLVATDPGSLHQLLQVSEEAHQRIDAEVVVTTRHDVGHLLVGQLTRIQVTELG